MAEVSEAHSSADHARLLRRGLWLEYVTLGWNVVGVIVLAIAALAANSVALAGFGLDSLIEILASTVVIWRPLFKVNPPPKKGFDGSPRQGMVRTRLS